MSHEARIGKDTHHKPGDKTKKGKKKHPHTKEFASKSFPKDRRKAR